MFVPSKFAVDDPAALDALVERDAFATLVSVVDGIPFATHLPVLYSRDGDGVRFRGHWARANPQWRGIASQTALLIVHGPHAYISPTWYEQPQQSVPTWNYAAAHVHGAVTLVESPDALAALVGELSARYESRLGSHWRFPDSAPGTAREIAGIVGFELTAQRVTIKHKLNQHHPATNVKGAIEGLRRVGDAGSADVANMMADMLSRRETPVA